MPNPNPYTPSYSFTSWQTNNPAKPLPAQQVDNEFFNVATSLNAAIAAISDVRRSDGALKNGIVTVDSLAPSLSIGWMFRGIWAADQNYLVADGVTYGTSFYRCNVKHTSANATRPDLDPVTWTFLFDASSISGAMSALTYDPQNIMADVFARANHTGTQAISTVTGLQTALDGKAASVHTHAISDVTGLQTALDDKQKSFFSSTAKSSLADTDLLGGADSTAGYAPVSFTLANLLTSTFKTSRTIPNARFEASTFGLVNAGGRRAIFDAVALSADRTYTLPNANLDFGAIGLKYGTLITASTAVININSGIPSDAKRITLLLELSNAGAAQPLIQLGTGGALETTGYAGAVAGNLGGAGNAAMPASSFTLINNASNAGPYYGAVTLARQNPSANKWIVTSILTITNLGVSYAAGSKTLAGPLDRIQIGSAAGTVAYSGTLGIIVERF